MAARTDEGTAPSFPDPDDALDLGRDVSRVFDGRPALRGDDASLRGLTHDRHLATRVRVDELRQRAIEDRRHVAARDRVPQEILRHLQLVARRSTRGEADLVAVGCQWLHGKSMRRSGRLLADGFGRCQDGRRSDHCHGRSSLRLRRRPRGCHRQTCLCPLRNLPHRRRRVRLGEAVSDQLLDLALAATRRGSEQVAMVLGGQKTRQQPHRRDRQRPVDELLEDLGKQPRRSCCLDPVVSRILGQAENVAAIGKERRFARAQIEPPRVELRQMGDELRHRVSLVACAARHFCDERPVRQVRRNRDRHVHS